MCARRFLLSAVLLVMLSACASHEVVRIPERSADLYPGYRAAGQVAVAVDPVRDGERSERYFGANLPRQDILPVVVVVSNHSGSRIAVDPAEIIQTRGTTVIDPLPPEAVIRGELRPRAASRQTRDAVEEYLHALVFQRYELMPGDTYRGVLFFPVTRNDRRDTGGFQVRDVFSGGLLTMSVAVTDMDRNERRIVGPFRLGDRFSSL